MVREEPRPIITTQGVLEEVINLPESEITFTLTRGELHQLLRELEYGCHLLAPLDGAHSQRRCTELFCRIASSALKRPFVWDERQQPEPGTIMPGRIIASESRLGKWFREHIKDALLSACKRPHTTT